jgi:4-nitrophenyl phosphatase
MNESSIQSLILDMDGVLWKGPQPIGDLKSIFDEISKRKLNVVMATNNATTSPVEYVNKLNALGVRVDLEQIITSGIATGAFLHEKYPQGGSIYILGEEGLQKTLQQYGFTISNDGVLAVVVGMDRNLTYEKLSKASRLIREGAEFIATNSDRTFPTPEGLIPGAGAIVAAVEAATGQKPVVIGKPQVEMYRIALEYLGTSPDKTLVVGDRIETDILGGQTLGCQTALVLSGVTDLTFAESWEPAPDFIAKDLESLLEML